MSRHAENRAPGEHKEEHSQAEVWDKMLQRCSAVARRLLLSIADTLQVRPAKPSQDQKGQLVLMAQWCTYVSSTELSCAFLYPRSPQS
mmetsp:Transcript_13269/g.37795  ORF Transcript_13269/g.37795 Transcript_13269/m.37795 type:complete len:88 (+) Transcript_13269:156-419(+)